MSATIRLFLIIAATPLAMVLACLGVETLEHTVAAGVLILIGMCYLIGGIALLWMRGNMPSAQGGERGDKSFWLILPGSLAVFYGPPLETLYLSELLPHPDWLEWCGTAIAGAGIALQVWAYRILGHQYTPHLQATSRHGLVVRGPYRYIRNPGYAGLLLLCLGVCIGYASPLGLAGLGMLFAALVYRMGIGERLLDQHYGDEYRAYRLVTNRLIPGVW